jgi:hypothetical protein
MRVLFGIIIGICLTISAAFVMDSWTVSPSTTTGSGTAVSENRPMVNWDVVDENWQIAKRRARDSWTALSQKVSS